MPGKKRTNVQRSDDQSSDFDEAVKRQRGFSNQNGYYRDNNLLRLDSFYSNHCIKSLMNSGVKVNTLVNPQKVKTRFLKELKHSSKVGFRKVYSAQELENLKELIEYQVLIETVHVIYCPVNRQTTIIVVDLTEDDDEDNAGSAPSVNKENSS